MLKPRKTVRTFLMAAALVLPLTNASGQTCPADETTSLITDMGERREQWIRADDSLTARVEGELERGQTRYLRILIEAPQGTAGWTLFLRDPSYRVVQTMGPADFAAAPRVWTQRLAAPAVILDLKAERPVSVTAVASIAMPEDAQKPYYSLKVPGAPDFHPIETMEPKRRILIGDSVGFLTAAYDRRSWTCSGVAVGKSLFLTNWHCGRVFTAAGDHPKQYWNERICADTMIDLSWDGDQVSQDFICAELLAKDESRDYALLRIAPTTQSRELRPASVKLERIKEGEPLTIIHHPASQRKKVSEKCSVRSASLPGWREGMPADARFTHDCDTEGGSSGAPVFDQNGWLRGLHHHGHDIDETTCRDADDVNKAIHLDVIFAHISDYDSGALRNREDVKAMFEAAGFIPKPR